MDSGISKLRSQTLHFFILKGWKNHCYYSMNAKGNLEKCIEFQLREHKHVKISTQNFALALQNN